MKLSTLFALAGMFAVLWSPAALADRIMDGLWLGSIDTGGDALETSDVDFLEASGGEREISEAFYGPEDGQEVGALGLSWETKAANMADQFDVMLLWGGLNNHTAYFYELISKRLMR